MTHRNVLLVLFGLLVIGAQAAQATDKILCTDVRQYVYCSKEHQEDLAGWTLPDVLVAHAITRGVQERIDLLTGGKPSSRVDTIIRYALNKEDRAPVILFLTRAMEPGAEEQLVEALYVVEVFGKRELMWVVHTGGAVEEVLARPAVQERLAEIAGKLHQKTQ